MIGFFNRFLSTWPARVFFMILLIALVGWGVGDMLRGIGRGGDGLAHVGAQTITEPQFEAEYHQQINRLGRLMGPSASPTPQMRATIANQVIDRMITQAAITGEVERLRLAVPDSALRQATFDIPAFKNESGKFDRTRFDAILRANNYTEPAFFAAMRTDLGQQQLIEAVRAGARAPDLLAKSAFAYQDETRVADMVTLPFASAAQPPAPDQSTLQRYYDNHPAAYTSPEYRKVKLVILSPETIARSITVPDKDLHAAYEREKARFNTAEQRSLQVVVAGTEATAQALARTWRGHADWPAIQKAAKAAGASTVAFDKAARADIPSPELAALAFGTQAGQIAGPVHSASGWQVARVVDIVAGKTKTFDQARPDLHAELAGAKAADVIYDRAEKVEDTLASGSKLDELPADLGLAAAAGTLDAQGNTPEGEPAPIPASPAVRAALLKAVFAAKPGQSPQLTEVPGKSGQPSSYYAFVVDSIAKPALKPFGAVQPQLRDDWLREARRHEQNVAATRLYVAVKNGGTLQQAAAQAGQPVMTTPPLPRPHANGNTAGPKNVPAPVIRILFGLLPQQGTMVETPEGFVVAQLTGVQKPDPATDATAYDTVRQKLDGAIADDIELSYVAALRDHAQPTVNRRKLNSVIEQPNS